MDLDGEPGGAVVIITGPPGAGKTTVAAALAGHSARPAVHLHSDDFYHYIRSGYIEPYRDEAHEQNRVVIGVLAGAAADYAAGGYLVLLDGIIGPWFLDAFRAPAALTAALAAGTLRLPPGAAGG